MTTSTHERFWSKVDKTPGHGPFGTCWVWTASGDDGYGLFRIEGKTRRAHRIAYEMAVEIIPDGLCLDHVCRVRNCVNPVHLEPVTNEENIRRGEIGKAQGLAQLAKTHCPSGHAYAGTNLYVDSRQRRKCRRCRADSMIADRAKKKAASP